jgi:isopenicillin-N epimerase
VTSLGGVTADWRALWRLDPAIAHCNHGSFGAVPIAVARAQQEWRDRAHSNPVRFFKTELRPAVRAARERAAAFLNADPAGLAMVPNATSGVSAVLAGVTLEPGDEVLVTDHGYGAVRYAVERACARTGARLVTVEIPLDADDVAARIEAGVTARTRLAVVDHVTSPTARRFPVEVIVPALRARGIAVLVDAAHAPGMLAVDLAALEPDFWVGNFHKWPCAPSGSAGLYVGARHRAATHPLVVSWGEPSGYPAAFDDAGTADLTPWLATPAALDLFDWDAVRRHNVALVAEGQRLVAKALGLDHATLAGDDGVSMRVLPLPPGLVETDEAAVALYGRIAAELGVEVNVTAWRGQGLLRISAHAYNTADDYRRLAAGLPLDW